MAVPLHEAAARGKVVCGGRPVSVGSVMLPPIAEGAEDAGTARNACVLAEETIVEVSSNGENDFTIELTPAAGEE